ncbi:hypothetical protein GCM10027217_40000 [Pseudomaricurvus hydrocarbonicus]
MGRSYVSGPAGFSEQRVSLYKRSIYTSGLSKPPLYPGCRLSMPSPWILSVQWGRLCGARVLNGG